MNKRTIILLVIAIAIWAAALGYYFLINGKLSINLPFLKKAEKPSTKVVHSIVPIKVTPEFLESYKKLVHREVETVDMFKPYYTEKGKEYMRDLIIESPNVIRSIAFAGYIITSNGGKIYLRFGNVTKSYGLNDLILDRYLIVYTSSIGVVVLDIKEGGLRVIR